MALEFRILGPLEVVGSEGAPVTLPGGRPGTVLAVLLVHANQAVSVDQLAEALWGDDPPPSAANALQAHVSKLRRAIGDRVSFTGAGYRLDLSGAVVDAQEFEARVAEGRALGAAGDAAGAARLLGDALALWSGPAFADFADAEFARAERVRLDELRAGAIEDRIDYELELGHGAELVGELEGLVVEHPLRERLRGQLMRALYRAGRQADALRAYQDARDTLVEELGIDPSPELRDLEASILAQDATLAPHARPEAVAPRARTNLHPPLTPLVGRTAELAAVRAELEGARLVTLVGPGGAGKTRLAVEAAPHQLAHHDDGVWMVELAGVLDPDSITAAIAEELRIPDAPRLGDGTVTAFDRVVDYLAPKDMLLVLDNCEHLVTEMARLAEQFLGRAPQLRILATSREGLGVIGERLWPVPPLPVDDAIELFSQRAAGLADVVVTEAERDTVRDVCERLDGLPLAIELAAARTRALPVGEISKRLDQRFRLLTGGSRTALPRQQTLRAVVDWSYGLLFDDEQRVFERLSVFAGGCTLEAAEAVCADDELPAADVPDLVARLVDKSLVQADRAGGIARFTMLQTLAQYGREQLASRPEAEPIRRRHANFFAGLGDRGVDAYFGTCQRAWLTEARESRDDVRAAIDWAIEHDAPELALRIAGGMGWFWWMEGRADEGYRVLERACRLTGDIDTLVRARALVWLTYLGNAGARSLPFDRLVAEAIRHCRDAGNERLLAFASFALAEVLLTHGLTDGVPELFAQARATSERLASDPGYVANHTYIEARAAVLAGDRAEGERLFRIAVEQADAVDNLYGSAMILSQLAEITEARGAYEDAADALRRAHSYAIEIGMPGAETSLLARLANVTMLLGDLELAAQLQNDALTRGRELGFKSLVSFAQNGIAMRLRLEGDPAAALDAASEALRIYTAAYVVAGMAQSHAILGFASADLDRRDDADRFHRDGLADALLTENPLVLALALEGLAGVAVLDGEGVRAARLLGKADALRSTTASSLTGLSRTDVDRITAAATEITGSDAFAAAFAAGAAESVEALTG